MLYRLISVALLGIAGFMFAWSFSPDFASGELQGFGLAVQGASGLTALASMILLFALDSQRPGFTRARAATIGLVRFAVTLAVAMAVGHSMTAFAPGLLRFLWRRNS